MSLSTRTKATREAERAVGKIEQAQAELARAVATLRAEGVTWRAIGTIINTSGQAAWKRFGDEERSA